jgi:hypothetical protein
MKENQLERIPFVFQPTYLDIIDDMPEDIQGQAALAAIRFGVDGEIDDSNPRIEMMLKVIASPIKRAKEKYLLRVNRGY